MRPDRDMHRMEVIDDAEAAVLRRMGGVRRLAMLNELTRFAVEMSGAGVRRRNPGWTCEQVQREVARITAHAAA